MLVHAGEAHVHEAENRGFVPMALYFRQATGIDPLTIDQTEFAARTRASVEHSLYAEARASGCLARQPVVLVDPQTDVPVGLRPALVDLYLFNRTMPFDDGHAPWETLGGRRTAVDVDVPECADRACYVSARNADEPGDALPVEHAVVSRTSRVRLHLPTGRPLTIIVEGDHGKTLATRTHIGSRRDE